MILTSWDIQNIPGTQMTSIFEGQPPKTRHFPIKTRVIWVKGDLLIPQMEVTFSALKSSPKWVQPRFLQRVGSVVYNHPISSIYHLYTTYSPCRNWEGYMLPTTRNNHWKGSVATFSTRATEARSNAPSPLASADHNFASRLSFKVLG